MFRNSPFYIALIYKSSADFSMSADHLCRADHYAPVRGSITVDPDQMMPSLRPTFSKAATP